MRLSRTIISSALSAAFWLTAAVGNAKADVILSLGYYDVAPFFITEPLPNPWYGSPNTSFLGDVSIATSSDPDEAALMLTNTGSSAVTLDQGLTVTSGSTVLRLWDSLIGMSGFTLGAGDHVILSATDYSPYTDNTFDGSDLKLIGSTISYSIDGVAYNAVDNQCSYCVGNSVLAGNQAGPTDETVTWTAVGPSAVPEPGTTGLVIVSLLLGLAGKCGRRRSRRD